MAFIAEQLRDKNRQITLNLAKNKDETTKKPAVSSRYDFCFIISDKPRP